MAFIDVPNGTQIAPVFPGSTADSALVRRKPESLADLLVSIRAQPTSQVPMLRSTGAKIAAFLGKPVDEISLDMVHISREGFRPFLEGQRHKEGSIRSYVNYLRILMDTAEKLGWKPLESLSGEWQPVLQVAKRNRCLSIIKYLAQSGKLPREIAPEDVDQWIKVSTERGRCYGTAHVQVNSAWRTLVECGFVKNAPVSYLRKKHYGVPLSDFPLSLRDEVSELLRWKSVEFEPERPKRAKIRSVSARGLRHSISGLYGYATKVADLKAIGSLEQLLQKPIVAGYITWCINEQKLKGGSLVCRLGSLIAAVSKHPAYESLDWSWFRPLLATIPADSYEEVKARKAMKYLDYDVLESIPSKIHAKIGSEAKFGEEHIARLAMYKLLIAWLLVFPWRQRNIRECRVAGSNPNVFRAKVSPFSYIDKPQWALQAEADNSNAEFWQVKFSRDETKTGVSVHSLVPHQLLGLLEEYVRVHRPCLLKGSPCNTLFVSPEGGEMGEKFVSDTVSDLTLRYGGRRVTPHLFRDIVAFAWLKAHPKDYLTLSRMLWHKNISTTINQYGSRFNDSSALVAMEAWLDERKRGSQWKQQ